MTEDIGIDAPELLQFLQQEEARAVDTKLNDARETALEFYRGEPFGDEVDGRSKLVTRDVAEVVDYMTVSVMRTLVSSDLIVEFEAGEPMMVPTQGPPDPQTGQPTQGQKDIAPELAQEATKRINWNFSREQDGYSILHDGIKAGLLEKIGVWKSWVERPMVPQPVRMNADDLNQADKIVQGSPQMVPDIYDLDAADNPVAVYDAVQLVPGQPVMKDAALPNEQFFFSPDTRTIDTSPYCGDWSRQSLHDLYAMGYPEAWLQGLWSQTPGDAQQLSNTRDHARQVREDDVVRVEWHRVVILREEYLYWFWQGIFQLVRVHRVGNVILSVSPVEDRPYTVGCPFPMQHRLVGDSLADKVMDIQVVRSHMLRQAMDNLYLSNAPRVWVDEGQIGPTTIDDLLDVAPGAIIRGKSGSQAPVPWDVPFVAGPAFEAMEVMAGEKESRTGITRLNQGLDADTLNKTATGTALMQASGQQIEEYVARNAANAIGELFAKKLKLFATEMPPHPFRIDGEVKQINPQSWPTDLRVSVRVGLGTGNKDKKLQAIEMMAQAQQQLREVDPRMVSPDNVFETVKLLASTLQLGPATKFVTDPAQLGPMPPQPDPKQQEADQKAQLGAAQLGLQQQKQATDAQLQQQNIQRQREKDIADAQLQMEKLDRETQIALFEAISKDQKFRSGGRLDA